MALFLLYYFAIILWLAVLYCGNKVSQKLNLGVQTFCKGHKSFEDQVCNT